MALLKDRRRRNGTAPASASEAEAEQIAAELEAVREWERRARKVGLVTCSRCGRTGCEHVRYLVEQLEAKR